MRLIDRMEVFSDQRPVEREAVNIHIVLDRVKQLAKAEFGDKIRIVEEYDPSLPHVFAQYGSTGAGVPEFGQETHQRP